MAGTKVQLAKSIHSAVGWTDRQIEADPGGYVRAFVEMGKVILKQRERDVTERMT